MIELVRFSFEELGIPLRDRLPDRRLAMFDGLGQLSIDGGRREFTNLRCVDRENRRAASSSIIRPPSVIAATNR